MAHPSKGIEQQRNRTYYRYPILRRAAQTNTVPTTVALQRMLSWVPTPIACGHCMCCGLGLGTHRFGLGTMLAVKRFCKGNRPLEHLPKKNLPKLASPTQGATPKSGSPYPQLKGPRQSMRKRERKTKERTHCATTGVCP